ncbi:hypothetical protein [Rhodoferax sp.]|uniref:hypothetical protein n=1 Tax=Rhodoferax sp. TaxID=50421 RepID=UPI002628CED3|nr:hypothetical protein [Rhodoferax sp.]MDD2918731.1 hypothetical protein [Rhodoferax sp.]
MKWRTLAWLLLLLNTLYWAWGEGWLLPYGFGPTQQREPQRLAQQIHPEAITVLRAAEGQPPLAVAPEPTVCLQSGPLNQAQADAVRALLEASWSPESWLLQEVEADKGWRLRLPALDQALQAQLPDLGAVMSGLVLEACTDDGAAR